MTIPLSNRFDSVSSAGASTGAAGLVPVVTIRAPTATDIRGPFGPFKIGQLWIDTIDDSAYFLTSYSPSNGQMLANWDITGATSTVSTITAGSGGSLTPSSGNINILGTPNQITSSGSGSTVTLSTPSTFIAPGSIAAAAGDITATNGDLNLSTAGNKLNIATGTNSSVGVSGSLSAGLVVVPTSAVTADSKIFLTHATLTGTGGTLYVDAITPGVSFNIACDSADDLSTVNWLIIN